MTSSKTSNPWTITQTFPSDLPVSVSALKERLRIDTADEDADLRSILSAAAQKYEADTNLALINRTVTGKFDQWPCGGEPIVLLPAPLSSVTSVFYLDSGGSSTEFTSDNYTVDTDSQTGLIWLGYQKSWPTLQSVARAITVTFVAGFGTVPHDVPEHHQQAILMLAGHWYANRETVIVGTISSEVPLAYESLTGTNRVPMWP